MALALVASLPQVALACPVCFSNGNPRVLEAYYLSVAFMSALPLLLLGGVAWWLYAAARRCRNAEPEARSQESGARSQEQGARSQKPGVRSQEPAENGVLPLAPSS